METVTEVIKKSPDTATEPHAHSEGPVHKIVDNPPQHKAGHLGSLCSDVFITLGTAEFSILWRISS